MAAAFAATCKQEFAVITVGTVALALAFVWLDDRRQPSRALGAAVLRFATVTLLTGVLLLRTVTWGDFVANYYPRESIEALTHFYRNM